MKPQISLTVRWRSLAVAMALALVVGVAGVQAAAPAPQITVHSQDLTSGVIMVDSVTSPVNGWIVVYKSPNMGVGDIVGYAPVHQGANSNVKVTIDTAKVGDLPTLWAVLQADNGVPGLFEWGLRGQPMNDGPIVENGHDVVASFGTAAALAAPAPAAPAAAAPAATATPAPAATAAPKAAVSAQPAVAAGPMVIRNQDITSGVIVADSVTSPANGWIVVYKDPNNLTPAQIVGYAPVHQGANSNVKITLDTAKVGDLPTLWAVLQADNSVPGLFEWGLRGLPLNDGPIVQNGHDIMTGFGTSAAMAAAAPAPAAPAAPAPVATAAPAPAPVATAAPKAPASATPAAGASAIVIKNQDITKGVIVADSVTSPANGWIVVYKDPNNLTPAQIVGYAPVHQGANSNVKITLDTAKVGDLPTLWAVLQADNGVPGLFEWGLRGQPLNDAPIVQNGHDIVAGFGTAAVQ